MIYLLSLSLLIAKGASELYCVDDNGENVDWYFIYKLPKLNSNGYKYLFVNGNSIGKVLENRELKWTLSQKEINDSNSHFGRTLGKVYLKNTAYTYVMYNDDPPRGKGNSYWAHSKGLIAMDSKSGFWLIHSIPNFPNNFTTQYDYPSTGDIYGQLALCISFKTRNQANIILRHLQTLRPNIYSSFINQNAPKNQTVLRSLIEKEELKYSYSNRNILTYNGISMDLFAKSSKAYFDIYSEKVAPKLRTNLMVETWRRNNPLISNCSSNYKVENIDEISFQSDKWTHTQDHAKWAISRKHGNYICIGDLNRMISQMRRGGGVACMKNTGVWKSFNGLVKRVTQCN